MGPLDPQKILARMQRRCAAAEMCSADARLRMRRWGLESEHIEGIMQKLIAGGYVNDRRYARAFASDKARLGSWGRLKIEMSLRAKRIPDTAIAMALRHIPDHVYDDALRAHIASRLRVIDHDDIMLRERMLRNAVARGYEYERARRIVSELLL